MMYQSIPLNENVDHMIEVEAGRALHTPSVRKQRECRLHGRGRSRQNPEDTFSMGSTLVVSTGWGS